MQEDVIDVYPLFRVNQTKMNHINHINPTGNHKIFADLSGSYLYVSKSKNILDFG